MALSPAHHPHVRVNYFLMGPTQVLRDKIGSAMRPKSSRFLLHTRMSLGSHLGSQMRKNCILQFLLGSQASYKKRQNCDPNVIPSVIPMNPSMQQLDTSLCHTYTDTLILRGGFLYLPLPFPVMYEGKVVRATKKSPYGTPDFHVNSTGRWAILL